MISRKLCMDSAVYRHSLTLPISSAIIVILQGSDRLSLEKHFILLIFQKSVDTFLSTGLNNRFICGFTVKVKSFIQFLLFFLPLHTHCWTDTLNITLKSHAHYSVLPPSVFHRLHNHSFGEPTSFCICPHLQFNYPSINPDI